MTIAGRLIALLFLLGTAGCSSDDAHYPPMPPIVDPPSFIVFFSWDDASLSQQAENTIKQFANYAKNGTFRIKIVGHTDRSGVAPYNMALSLRRANAVKAAVVQHGVSADWIVIEGKGETQPLVLTPDGVREPQNRRVEMYLAGRP